MKIIIGFCGDWDKSQKTRGRALAPFLEPFLAVANHHLILRINREGSKINYWRTSNFSFPLKLFTRWIRSKKKPSIRFWHFIFRFLQPKCVFAIEPTPEMCYFARKYKTKLVEVLHFYGLDPSDPKYGLAQEQTKHRLFRPEYNVVFDEKSFHTRKQIDKMQGSKSFHCQPLLPSFRKKQKRSRPHVLYTCQWGYDGEYPFLDGILKNGFIPEAIMEQIKRDESINWLIKLHPVQVQSPKKTKYIKLLNESLGVVKNWQWQQPSSVSVWENLNQVDLHITMSSAAVYEAAFLGKYSLTLCPTLLEGGIYQNHYTELAKKRFLSKIDVSNIQLENIIKLKIGQNLQPLSCGNAQSTHEIISALLK